MLLAIVAVSLTNPFKDFLVSFLHGNAPFVHVATMVAKNLAKVLIKMAAFHAVIKIHHFLVITHLNYNHATGFRVAPQKFPDFN